MTAQRQPATHYGTEVRPVLTDLSRPEPAGPRAVALELVRVGLVRGDPPEDDDLQWGWRLHITGAEGNVELHEAARHLARSGAIARDSDGMWRLTAVGAALAGPELRQRGWLSTR